MAVINPVRIGAAQSSSGGYQRPSDWLTLPAISAGENKMNGLHTVYDREFNFMALHIRGANYTVNIYNKTTLVESFIAQSSYFYYNFDYSDFQDTECSRGYRQAIVEIIAEGSDTFTDFNFSKAHPTPNNSTYSSGWLDINIAGSDITTCFLAGNRQDSNAQINHFYIERFNAVDLEFYNLVYNFYNLRVLQELIFTLSSSIPISMHYTFYSCNMLPDSFFEELYNSLDTSLISSINYSGHKGNLTIDISNIGTLTYISSYCQSLTLINGNVIDHDFSLSCNNTSIESFIIDDASTIINTSNAWTLCRNLKHFEAPGIKIRFSLNYAPLSFSEIEDIIYNQIADLTGDTSQSLSFTNCYGAADAGMAALATWAASNKNWTIIY